MGVRFPYRTLMTTNSLAGRTVTAGNQFIATLGALRLELFTFAAIVKLIIDTNETPGGIAYSGPS